MSHPMLTVKQAGPLALIQDAGRFGVGHLGVTQGGAADWIAFRWANWHLTDPRGQRGKVAQPSWLASQPGVSCNAAADKRGMWSSFMHTWRESPVFIYSGANGVVRLLVCLFAVAVANMPITARSVIIVRATVR